MLNNIYEYDMLLLAADECGEGDEKGATGMSHLFSFNKIYCHVLEGEKYSFADERTKKKLLDAVCQVKKNAPWHICAFCLTDDKAYFVIEADSPGQPFRALEQAVECFFGQYTGMGAVMFCPPLQLQVRLLAELNTLEELALWCRSIHCLPVELGYVRHLSDYWWSSYITYTGSYLWDIIDSSLLWLYFSVNPVAARRKLIRFHQGFHRENGLRIKM